MFTRLRESIRLLFFSLLSHVGLCDSMDFSMPVFPVLQGESYPKPNFPRMPGAQDGGEVQHLPPEALKSLEIHQLLVVQGSRVPWVQMIS